MSKYNEKITNKYLPKTKSDVLQKQLKPHNEFQHSKKIIKGIRKSSVQKNYPKWDDIDWQEIIDAVVSYFNVPTFSTKPRTSALNYPSEKAAAVISKPSSSDYRRAFSEYYRTIPSEIKRPINTFWRSVPDPFATIESKMYQNAENYKLGGMALTQPWWSVIKQTGIKGYYDYTSPEEIINLLESYLNFFPKGRIDKPASSRLSQLDSATYDAGDSKVIAQTVANMVEPTVQNSKSTRRALQNLINQNKLGANSPQLTRLLDELYEAEDFVAQPAYRDIDTDSLIRESQSPQFQRTFPELTDKYASRILGTGDTPDIEANERAFVQQLKPKESRPQRKISSVDDQIVMNRWKPEGFLYHVLINPNLSDSAKKRFFTPGNFPYSVGEFLERATEQDIDEIANVGSLAIRNLYKRNKNKRAKK